MVHGHFRYMQALRAHPKDSELLKCIGNIYDEQGDRSQAFQYYHDAYRYDPSNLQTIEWLGSYYIDSQYPEKAVEYFEKAALGRPHQVKWQLMVASCYRRSGNYAAALEHYKLIHRKFPDNIECNYKDKMKETRRLVCVLVFIRCDHGGVLF